MLAVGEQARLIERFRRQWRGLAFRFRSRVLFFLDAEKHGPVDRRRLRVAPALIGVPIGVEHLAESQLQLVAHELQVGEAFADVASAGLPVDDVEARMAALLVGPPFETVQTAAELDAAVLVDLAGRETAGERVEDGEQLGSRRRPLRGAGETAVALHEARDVGDGEPSGSNGHFRGGRVQLAKTARQPGTGQGAASGTGIAAGSDGPGWTEAVHEIPGDGRKSRTGPVLLVGQVPPVVEGSARRLLRALLAEMVHQGVRHGLPLLVRGRAEEVGAQVPALLGGVLRAAVDQGAEAHLGRAGRWTAETPLQRPFQRALPDVVDVRRTEFDNLLGSAGRSLAGRAVVPGRGLGASAPAGAGSIDEGPFARIRVRHVHRRQDR